MIFAIIALTILSAALAAALVVQGREHARALDRLLARVAERPQLEIRPVEAVTPVQLEHKPYITDLEHDDADWNEYRGEPDPTPDEAVI